jgi:hypothetical protein
VGRRVGFHVADIIIGLPPYRRLRSISCR